MMEATLVCDDCREEKDCDEFSNTTCWSCRDLQEMYFRFALELLGLKYEELVQEFENTYTI